MILQLFLQKHMKKLEILRKFEFALTDRVLKEKFLLYSLNDCFITH